MESALEMGSKLGLFGDATSQASKLQAVIEVAEGSMRDQLETSQRACAYAAIAQDKERTAAIEDSALYAARHGLA